MSNQVGSSGAKKSPLPLFKLPLRLHRWSFEEERALVEFVGLALMDPKYGITNTTLWPAFCPIHPFWTDTAGTFRPALVRVCFSLVISLHFYELPKGNIAV